MKGIIFGKGFLGTRISNELNFKIIGREINPLDISLFRDFLNKEKPEIIINAIGKTSGPDSIGIDWCETHKEETTESNITIPLILATECSLRGIFFVQLGSGCIYSGDKKVYSEEDEPNFYGPQFYAKTKIISEKILREFPCLILRIRMPIDNTPHERNLITKLANYPKVINIQNSMSVIPDFIKAIRIMLNKRLNGIYNLVNPGTISATEIMQMYQKIVDPEHKFNLLSLEELDKITLAKRSNCILSTKKLEKEGIVLPEIHSSVENCLKQYKEFINK